MAMSAVSDRWRKPKRSEMLQNHSICHWPCNDRGIHKTDPLHYMWIIAPPELRHVAPSLSHEPHWCTFGLCRHTDLKNSFFSLCNYMPEHW